MAQQKLVFELAPGILVALRISNPGHPAEITVSDPPEHNQAASRQRPVLCPYRHIDTLCNILNEGTQSAVTAVVCHAFGEEKRVTCLDCEDGPFDSCVVYLHGGCSNCIFAEREESCLWQQLDKRDSNSKRDHAPPPKTRGSDETGRPGPKQGTETPADDSPCSNRPRRKRHAETPTDDPRPSKRRNTLDAESDDCSPKLSPFYDLTGEGK